MMLGSWFVALDDGFRFAGTLPRQLGELALLEALYVERNQLTGESRPRAHVQLLGFIQRGFPSSPTGGRNAQGTPVANVVF